MQVSHLGTLQSDGAVTVSGGTTTIDNDSALALEGSVTRKLGSDRKWRRNSDSAALALAEPRVSPTPLMQVSILVPCSQMEQLPWMVEPPQS